MSTRNRRNRDAVQGAALRIEASLLRAGPKTTTRLGTQYLWGERLRDLGSTYQHGGNPVTATTTRRAVYGATILSSTLIVACGGGSEVPLCTASARECVFNPPALTRPSAVSSTASLAIDAPDQVALDAGSTATYRVRGGAGGYTVASGNTGVVRGTVEGGTLSLVGVSPGKADVAVVDSSGAKRTVQVSVLAQGSGGSPLSLTPGDLTLGNCTTGVPFIFRGGVGPFTIYTNDNFSLPVSAPLRLDAERFYFFVDTRYRAVTEPVTVSFDDVPSILTVIDSQSRTATATVTTRVTRDACPSNPLFKASPESATFRTSEIRAFQLTGGSAAAPVSVTFSDPSPAPAGLTGPVVEVVSVTPTTLTVRARATVAATTLMTILGTDGQRTSVVLNVLPQP
jgi:hypothetical protein